MKLKGGMFIESYQNILNAIMENNDIRNVINIEDLNNIFYAVNLVEESIIQELTGSNEEGTPTCEKN